MHSDGSRLCVCGCGQSVNPGKTYRRGHHWKMIPLADRFWGKVRKNDDPTKCWEWTAHRDGRGYGLLSFNNGAYWRRAHRIAWELTYGPIPGGHFVCHRCDNPPCVNPDHLFLGTPAENVADMHQKGRMGVAPSRPGEANPFAKLTNVAVRDIRVRYAANAANQYQLAAEYGVSQSTVWRAIHRGAWASLEVLDQETPPSDATPRGTRHHNAKLTEKMVRTIRSEFVPGTASARLLAERFRVTPSAIRQIIRGRRWCHVA